MVGPRADHRITSASFKVNHHGARRSLGDDTRGGSVSFRAPDTKFDSDIGANRCEGQFCDSLTLASRRGQMIHAVDKDNATIAQQDLGFAVYLRRFH